MEYQIKIPKKAQKDLEKIDKRIQSRIKLALIAIRDNPYIGKKLDGQYQDCRSHEVWPYRIIYKIQKKYLIIEVIRIGHRQGVY